MLNAQKENRCSADLLGTQRCQRVLGYTLLAYMTLMIAIITLIPFAFSIPKSVQFTLRGNLSDVFTNIVLFVPLGFFFQIIHGQFGLKSSIMALCFGLVVSGLLEVGQLFLPSRCSSVIDFIMNGSGACLGAAVAGYHQVMVRKGRVPEIFGFRLPLIWSVYLLVPLLWLGGFSMGNEISRIGLMVLIGIYGGGVISSAIVNRSMYSSKRIGLAVFSYAAGWFMIGAAPALTRFPLAILGVGLLVGFAAQLSCCVWKKNHTTERRFELPTLKRLFPIYLFYLFLLSVWSTTIPLGEWTLRGDFHSLYQAERVLFIARFVEVIAAFTLLGYLLAEMSGRKKQTRLGALNLVVIYILGIAIFTTTLRNIRSELLFMLVEAFLFAMAGIYGAIIYRLQLNVVRGPRKKRKLKKPSSTACLSVSCKH
ncbi:putative membrane protein, VanZ-like [Desulfosarcina variabilis str. Montpellier]